MLLGSIQVFYAKYFSLPISGKHASIPSKTNSSIEYGISIAAMWNDKLGKLMNGRSTPCELTNKCEGNFPIRKRKNKTELDTTEMITSKIVPKIGPANTNIRTGKNSIIVADNRIYPITLAIRKSFPKCLYVDLMFGDLPHCFTAYNSDRNPSSKLSIFIILNMY